MHTSKAQVTLFFIVGIIFIASIFIYSQFEEKQPRYEQLFVDRSHSDLQQYVESCLKKVGEDGIYHVMLQGGYHYPPIESLTIENADIAYYWKSENRMPSLSEIEKHLSYYVFDNLPQCLGDFSAFSGQGISVDAGVLSKNPTHFNYDDVEITTTAIGDSVVFVLDAPVTLRKGSRRISLDTFSSEVKIAISQMYKFTSEILEEQSVDPNVLPTGAIGLLAHENNFRFETVHYDNNTVIISLIFENPTKDDLIYAFAHEYSWSDVS